MAQIKIIDDSAEARRFSEGIRNLFDNDYIMVNDHLLHIARNIEMYGEVTFKEIQQLKDAQNDCKMFAEGINEILKGVGYAV